MSFYNAINGFNLAGVFLLPMLGRKPEDYPRFRDCFLEDGKIAVYTRVGGNNRNCGYGEEELYRDPNYVSTYDDDFDPTYGTYLFSVPGKWKADFNLIVAGKFPEVSDEYYEMICAFYPNLAEKGLIGFWLRPDCA